MNELNETPSILMTRTSPTAIELIQNRNTTFEF